MQSVTLEFKTSLTSLFYILDIYAYVINFLCCHCFFTEDYRMASCFGFVKCFVEKYKDIKSGGDDKEEEEGEEEDDQEENVETSDNKINEENKENNQDSSYEKEATNNSKPPSASSTKTTSSSINLPTDGSSQHKETTVETNDNSDNDESGSGKESKLSDVSTIVAENNTHSRKSGFLKVLL